MNEPFGWIWIMLGVLSGALLGTGFLRPDFLGGYTAPRRRLIRLGHISFFGLGGLNVLFARSIAGHVDCCAAIASIALVVSAISMPLACALVAWRRSWFALFSLPAAAALLATGLIVWELLT